MLRYRSMNGRGPFDTTERSIERNLYVSQMANSIKPCINKQRRNLMKVFDKRILSIALGASLMLGAGAAHANTQISVNGYGASAQFTYWSKTGRTFLTNVEGCTQVTEGTSTDGSTHYIAVGTGCSGGRDITLRYTSKASFDGVLSQSNNASLTDDATCQNAPLNLDGSFRVMAAGSSAAAGGTGGITGTGCYKVNFGASDVAASSFIQESHGYLAGPFNASSAGVATVWTNRVFPAGGLGLPAGFNTYNPIVVPFTFFTSNNVTVKYCSNFAGTSCNAETDCNGTNGTTTFCQAAAPINNLSRAMAVNLFAGKIKNWSDFGPGYPSLGVAVCYRHAGSGTHATLDLAVMRANGWGAKLPINENNPYDDPANTDANGNLLYLGTYDNAAAGNFSYPYLYFNDATGDMMNCLTNTDGTGAEGVAPSYNVAGPTGTVGYADADKTKTNVHSLSYNGVYATRTNIKNGAYDFWTKEWAYENTAPTADGRDANDTFANTHPIVLDLMNYAANPANLTATGKGYFWATQNELNVNKNGDLGYPTHK